ncbi:MAG: hypothetical protein ACUVQ2_04580 [Dissulfurimicrobium sp.]|uniref:hypothetical protein n=1 Tax=Dissulfurimicrobium sp. TaxID=2022436 RepID=UPI00404AA3C1
MMDLRMIHGFFIKTLAEDSGHVRGIRLGRNMGQYFAVLAGFSLARMDIVGAIDADL